MTIFCHCRSKKMTSDVIASTSTASTSRRTTKSDQSNRNSSTFISTDSNSYNKDSWKSSVSSQTSLSSLRDSLPENPHVYDFKEIFTATNRFLSAKHSSSSSSAAWRCTIRGDDVIVFQRKLRRPINESELRERLLVICKSHHSSLIKLRGASMSGCYIYLVYDFVKGVSLADGLKNPRNPNFTVISDWMSRIKIAADLAHGLDYIHNSTGFEKKFVHNHIKTTSIIVTNSSIMNAKICHFGTAELCGESDSITEQDSSGLKVKFTKFEGTRGYMSPEFQSTGIPTQKSDVYAFGVVILEILSGEEPLKYRKENGNYVRISLIETAREAEDGGGVRRWMDKKLKDSFPVEVVEKLVKLGMECVEEDPNKRPDMSVVAGRVSKLYLESKYWMEQMRPLPADFTVSMAPR
ncbi:lysM domain receptor-like kinase 3 [Rutidosis leptorrhynchoides]|uniref:lysM domain receptor-like kinase 3 n=1 Tax=Rutidosis leptorrhynchoides TaxID=125765 RepID=UPI003A9A2F17